MNDTKALEREQLIKDLGTIYYGSTIAKRAADLIESQAAQLEAIRSAILNQCGSELAESIEIEAHHAK